MLTQSTVGSAIFDDSRVYLEGIIAGVIGALTIAIWFLILDTIGSRPLYTPSVLGTVLFGGGNDLASLEKLPVSWEMTLMYTWVHTMLVAVIGGIVSKLLALAEKDPDLGFGILLLFIILEFGFIAAAFVFAEPILHALTWPAVFVGNLLTAAAMGLYFWHHHPDLVVRP